MSTLHLTKNKWIHWLNESEGIKKGWRRAFLYRLWFHFTQRKCVHIEVASNIDFGISITREEWDLQFHLGLIFFSIFFTLEGFFDYFHPNGDEKVYEGRELSFKIHHWTIWWNIWTDPNSWSSKTPKWRNGSFDMVQTLFGPNCCGTHVHAEYRNVSFNWRETDYNIDKVEFITREWYKPRVPKWIWNPKKTGADITFDTSQPPQRAGKGTASWNCGDDGTWGITILDATDLDDAVYKYCLHNANEIKYYGRASTDKLMTDSGRLVFTSKWSKRKGEEIWIRPTETRRFCG